LDSIWTAVPCRPTSCRLFVGLWSGKLVVKVILQSRGGGINRGCLKRKTLLQILNQVVYNYMSSMSCSVSLVKARKKRENEQEKETGRTK
jgi:hypothetical protein